MNCAECKEILVAYIEELLSESQKQAVILHLENCPSCQADAAELTGLRNRLTANAKAMAQTNLEDKVLDRIIREQSLKLRKANKINKQLQLWRIIMRSKISKLAAAAVIIIAILLSISLFDKSMPTASAAEIFHQAAEVMAKLKSFHIKVEMRTLPGDNFAVIGLDYDFVQIDFWKQSTGDCWGKWRLEEPGRVVVMDGECSTMLCKAVNYVHEVRDRSPERYWDECLVEVDKVIRREAQQATKDAAELELYHEQDDDGRDKIVIIVEAQSKVPETDYLRNKYIENSDHRKVYRFDAETKLLEDLQIYVHDKDRDVLVFELVQAEYNIDLDPALFRLELPENVIRSVPLEILPDNERYEKMSPKEAATVFFGACADEDWDEALKFMGQSGVSQQFKDYLGGLEIIEIGEPFKSSHYRGWFVPYKIKLKSGHIKEHNLALRKDNQANRFEYDGGI